MQTPTPLEPSSLFPFPSAQENIQRKDKAFLLTAQFHIAGVSGENINSREKLHALLAEKKISGEEFEKKVIYLGLIANLSHLILSQFNKIDVYSKVFSKQDLFELAEAWFTNNLPSYVAKTLPSVADADITTYTKHSSQHLKFVFETLLRNFWSKVLDTTRRKSSEPEQIFAEMQSMFKCCSNLPNARDYVYNVLASQLMQLFYACKNAPVSDVEISTTDETLAQKVQEKITSREPERVLGLAPKPTSVLAEVVIFDIPRRKTVFDELRQDWAARNKANAPLDAHGIFTADPNFKP